MGQVLADRVMETTATTGTGTYTLAGAKSGYRPFSGAMSNGDQCVYCVTDYVDYEVVEGVYSSGTLTRVSIKKSSNSNSAVSWSAGNKDIFLVADASTVVNVYGLNAFAADQSMGSHKLTNLSSATTTSDAANYGQILQLAIRKFVEYVSVSNVVIASTNAGTSFDSVTSTANECILLAGQSDNTENGIYTINASGGLTRRSDFATGMDPRGVLVTVIKGSTYSDTVWMCSSNGSSIGSSGQTYNLISFSNAVAGDGLVRSGNALNVVGTSDRISVAANAIDIAATYVGQTSITTLGTITTGTWHGSTVAVAYGGTGTTNGSITGGASSNLVFTAPNNYNVSLATSGTGYIDLTSAPVKNKVAYSDLVTVTDGATITVDWSLGKIFQVTIAATGRTLAFSNAKVGQCIYLEVKQDGTGSRTITTYPTTTNWMGGSAPTLSTTANKCDGLFFICMSSGVYRGFLVGTGGA